jgi:hypothetical protein
MDYPHVVIMVARYLRMPPADPEADPYWLARGLEVMEAESWAQDRYQQALKHQHR